jgi:hypothetical protein
MPSRRKAGPTRYYLFLRRAFLRVAFLRLAFLRVAFFLPAFFLAAFFFVAFFLVAFFLRALFLTAFFLVAFFLVAFFFRAAILGLPPFSCAKATRPPTFQNEQSRDSTATTAICTAELLVVFPYRRLDCGT